MGLEPAIFERLRNSSFNKLINLEDCGGLSYIPKLWILGFKVLKFDIVVVERSVINIELLWKHIWSDNANMSKK